MANERAIATRPAPLEISALLEKAVVGQASIETLERLLAMAKDVRAEQAKAAWHEAMAAFQREAPDLTKKREATVPTKSGGRFTYRYASLSDLIAEIRPVMAKFGLSATFRMDCSRDKVVTATCIVSHEAGHSESCQFSVPVETSNPAINGAQAVGSASTYARRYAYQAALGLAPEDEEDDDGAGPGKGPAERPREQPQRKSEQKSAAPSPSPAPESEPEAPPKKLDGNTGRTECFITAVTKKPGSTNGNAWLLYEVKTDIGHVFGTLSDSLADLANSLTGSGEEAVIEWTLTKRGHYKIDTIERLIDQTGL